MTWEGSRVSLSTSLELDPGVVFQVGRRVTIRERGEILIEGNSKFEIGDGSTVMQGSEIAVTRGGQLSIGADVYIGAYSNIRCSGSIVIGDGVRLAQFVSVIDANYSFHRRDLPIAETTPERVTIGRGAWLGAQVVVLPGVEIGEGAVVGAGSVVTKNVPAFGIVGGNPARMLGQRGETGSSSTQVAE